MLTLPRYHRGRRARPHPAPVATTRNPAQQMVGQPPPAVAVPLLVAKERRRMRRRQGTSGCRSDGAAARGATIPATRGIPIASASWSVSSTDADRSRSRISAEQHRLHNRPRHLVSSIMPTPSCGREDLREGCRAIYRLRADREDRSVLQLLPARRQPLQALRPRWRLDHRIEIGIAVKDRGGITRTPALQDARRAMRAADCGSTASSGEDIAQPSQRNDQNARASSSMQGGCGTVGAEAYRVAPGAARSRECFSIQPPRQRPRRSNKSIPAQHRTDAC